MAGSAGCGPIVHRLRFGHLLGVKHTDHEQHDPDLDQHHHPDNHQHQLDHDGDAADLEQHDPDLDQHHHPDNHQHQLDHDGNQHELDHDDADHNHDRSIAELARTLAIRLFELD